MRQTDFAPIITPRLLLRRFRASDLPTLWAYRNDPEVARYQAWSAFSEAALSAYISEQSTTLPFRPGGGFQFALELREAAMHIGDLFVRLLEYDHGQIEIGYTLARAYHRQGYASEAVGALFDEAFLRHGMHRAMALVDSANLASIALLERLGLRREGYFLQSFQNRGAWRDEYQYAILRSEWVERRISR